MTVMFLDLGSARASRAGDDALASRTFCFMTMQTGEIAARAPQSAREACAPQNWVPFGYSRVVYALNRYPFGYKTLSCT
jgi:hypothetical protein